MAATPLAGSPPRSAASTQGRPMPAGGEGGSRPARLRSAARHRLPSAPPPCLYLLPPTRAGPGGRPGPPPHRPPPPPGRPRRRQDPAPAPAPPWGRDGCGGRPQGAAGVAGGAGNAGTDTRASPVSGGLRSGARHRPSLPAGGGGAGRERQKGAGARRREPARPRRGCHFAPRTQGGSEGAASKPPTLPGHSGFVALFPAGERDGDPRPVWISYLKGFIDFPGVCFPWQECKRTVAKLKKCINMYVYIQESPFFSLP